MSLTEIWILVAVATFTQAATSCKDGTYGPGCVLSCGEHCSMDKCDTDSETGTYQCSAGCKKGWTGRSCDRKCAKGCSVCQQNNGTCVTCMKSCCGKSCTPTCDESETCERCADSRCHICEQGWYGKNCTVPCPSGCDSGCSKLTGECKHQCISGLHGLYCRTPCTSTCRDGCHQTDGVCIGGCQIGWHGEFCNQSCNNTCMNRQCYQTTGQCLLGSNGKGFPIDRPRCQRVWTKDRVVKDCSVGCEAGWRGERCDLPCPRDCYSCSRYPDGTQCQYRKDVVEVHSYGNAESVSGERVEMRTVYTMLLVVPPFLIVGAVQLFCVSWEAYRRRRDKKVKVIVA